MSHHSKESRPHDQLSLRAFGITRGRIATTLAFSLIVAMLASCQDNGTVAADDVVGVWRSGSVFVQFNEDQTFQVARAADQLASAPIDLGSFRIRGSDFSYISDEESASCSGQTGLYEVHWVEEGGLQFTNIEDPCLIRGTTLSGGPIRPFEP